MIAARTQVAFHADSALDLLFQQFRLRGTPDESVWPGIGAVAQSAFSGGVAEWPKWRPKSLRDEYPCLDPDGVSLLDQMLTLDPARRISAADALVHHIGVHAVEMFERRGRPMTWRELYDAWPEFITESCAKDACTAARFKRCSCHSSLRASQAGSSTRLLDMTRGRTCRLSP